MTGGLRQLAPNLHVVDHDFKMGLFALGARTTVVVLEGGGLWVHSPGPLTDSLASEIEALGPLRCLIAPNLMHHLFVGDWVARFPEARVHAVAGLEDIRPDLRIDETLGDAPSAAWKGEVEQLRLAGVPKLDEVVFLHAASRTLVLTDLCFNFHTCDSFATRVLMRVNAAWQRFTPSRLFKSFIKDGDALRDGVERILEWDFDRVIVAHGEVLDSGGAQALREAYGFLGVGAGRGAGGP